MYEVLIHNISEKIDLSAEEQAALKIYFQPKKIRKRQYLLQEGDMCKFIWFIEKGLLRMYTVDDQGFEHMMQFAMEGWWMVDVYSFFTSTPSRYNIDALEDSEMLMLHRDHFDDMMTSLPKMERCFRILYQNNIIAKERRLESSISAGAEAQYLQFTQMYPRLVQRLPLNLIASYLGITPETLSRIRRNLTAKDK